jgi:hypothetical protein
LPHFCLTFASPSLDEEEKGTNKKEEQMNYENSPSEAKPTPSEAKVRQAVRQNPLPHKDSEAVRQNSLYTLSSLAVNVGDQVLFEGKACKVLSKNGSLLSLKPVDGGCSFWAKDSECYQIPTNKPLSVGDWVRVSWSDRQWQVSAINGDSCHLSGIDRNSDKVSQFWVNLADCIKSEAESSNGKK